MLGLDAGIELMMIMIMIMVGQTKHVVVLMIMMMMLMMMMMGQMMLLPCTIYMGHAGHMGTAGRKCPDLHHRPKAPCRPPHNGDDDDDDIVHLFVMRVHLYVLASQKP